MIRHAEYDDLDTIMEIYGIAREFMKEYGNPTQWGDTYPSRTLIEDDIKQRCLFVYTKNAKIHGVFYFCIGEEPTYNYIENGSWEHDKLYGAIHRVASDGEVKGILKKCLKYCKEQINHIRIDTHFDNHVMQHLLEKNGFTKCGTIYLDDESPRLAYNLYYDIDDI